MQLKLAGAVMGRVKLNRTRKAINLVSQKEAITSDYKYLNSLTKNYKDNEKWYVQMVHEWP
jgi:hypothetical protein